MNFTFTFGTFAMAMAGLLIHFLTRWAEHFRQYPNPWTYLTLDLPSWLLAVVGAIVFYFALPEIGKVTGSSVEIGVTPLWSLAAGYMGSSMCAKLLAIFAGRAGVR